MEKNIIIAIDGHSSCGKSTLAKALAKELDYIFIDTGAMYRAVTLFCYEHNLIGEDFCKTEKIIDALPKITLRFVKNPKTEKLEITLNQVFVEQNIRNLTISSLVSKIAAIKEVRQKLVAEQQAMGEKGGIIMDGRDIGSVVFPNAEIKFFITAKAEVRAKRRYLELQNTDPTTNYEEVLKNVIERDQLDSTRKESPLIQTDDAILIDNSNIGILEQYDLALNYIKEKITMLSEPSPN